MRTIDLMSPRDLQDLRDAGRGHLIDGSEPLRAKADELRKLAKEEPALPPQAEAETVSSREDKQP